MCVYNQYITCSLLCTFIIFQLIKIQNLQHTILVYNNRKVVSYFLLQGWVKSYENTESETSTAELSVCHVFVILILAMLLRLNTYVKTN